jgi:hypothetical protein
MAKYQDYRKFMTSANTVFYETVKGYNVIVENSPYSFYKEKGTDILTNVESGIGVGVLEYTESHIDFINHEITEALKYFGNIASMDDSKKVYPSWYWQFAHEFKTIFGFTMPIDICGLDVIKLDSFIRPRDGESTREAIQKKHGQEAANFVDSILNTAPYMFYFYNPTYKAFNHD